MKETLRITNLGELEVGDIVNVERAAKFSDEIGGHLMSGHIMSTAENVKNLAPGKKMHTKTRGGYFADRQANAVDADKSFIEDVFHQRRILHLKPDLTVIFRGEDFDDFRGRHNMARH